ncbi:MAG TPA: carboxypeptidase-like regulatory domain-containing protein [Chitinophagaceae bacterium]|nr:carboxypeptidase-like regulatory domain-containing protein [Chitinophagaceae bacterium]
MQKLLQPFLGTVLFVACLPSFAQYTLSGVVLDSATREPLAGTSVFAQNTTLGTATARDGSFSLGLKPGGYDIVFSYTGYKTQQQTLQAAENTRLEILLVKEDKSLTEVVVRSSNEVTNGWEKYGNFFTAQFIGSTPNARECSLLNPEVLKFFFSKRQNKLKVLATEPLQISNRALGYNLNYQLDSFVHHYGSDITSYRGFCLYTEMEGTDSLRRIWERNRVLAYHGSKLHFLRSYYDSTLHEEGFIISILDEQDASKFNRISDPYDTAYYVGADTTLEAEIWFPRKLNVTYTKKIPEEEYLRYAGLPRNLGVQVSYVELKQAVAIKENGYYYDQKDWISQGYWSWKNLADQLPADYQ